MEKSGILSQSSGLIERLRRHPWTLGAAGALSALGMATAFAVSVPGQETVRIETVVEQLDRLSGRPLDLGDAAFLHEERIQRGDTLGNVLSRLGVQEPEALAFLRTDPSTRPMHQQLVPGKVVVARTSADGDLHALYFPLNGKDSALVVERTGGELEAREQALRFETQTLMKSAEIRSSLFEATDDAGIPDGVAVQLAEIFSGDIDFHRDLRKGDRFAVVYEMQYLSGQPARAGNILAAEFSNGGKAYRAIRFGQGARAGYYTADGKSLRKAFLRSPLEFSRVTSGFSMRFHPILKEWRAHRGVDYGAPAGTRVRSTGDGVVDFAGRQGGYGNVVVIRHAGQYSTAYGHLKGFAPGIRKGSRVNQGDTIGYVGQTGWATGPHLHYEFRVDGRQVNPLALNLPLAVPLEARELASFKAQAAPLAARLDLLRDSKLAALE